MRSPDNARAFAETALRGVAIIAMSVLAVRLWSGSTKPEPTSPVSSTSLDSALASWTASSPSRVTLRASTLPDVRQRDWLIALRRAGVEVAWQIADSTQVALVAEAGVGPRQPVRLLAHGTPASAIQLRDDLGVLDSSNTGDDGAASWRASPVGTVRAQIRNAIASAEPRDSLRAKPLLVIGQAGWETKFVTAALEESGWSVSTRIMVAPTALVRQGTAGEIDTASFSAVVVLDSISSVAPVARFVRDGGGLVAAGPGVNHPALRAILPRATTSMPGEIGALLGPTPKMGLQARRLRGDTASIALERRAGEATVRAHRVGMGRVVAVGYDDTWRLRLAPPDESAPENHRAWWSSLVAGVARVSLVGRETASIDEAPLAATIDALGAPGSAVGETTARRWPWSALLVAIAALALLAEWLSRRLRGVA